jgi:hypothetical protein
LNKVWVRNNALLELEGGLLKMVERVTMTRGAPYELVARSNFQATDRDVRASDEFRCKISDLISGSANNVKSVLFGFLGVPFVTAPRKGEEVVDVHGIDGSIREVSVLAWAGEGRRPALATAQKISAADLLKKVKVKAIGKVARSEPQVAVRGLPLIAEALQASGLGGNGCLAATPARQFLAGVLDKDTSSWPVATMEARLRELQEKMHEQRGPQPPWRWARESGILRDMPALQAGEALKNMYWARPKASNSERRKRGRPAVEEDGSEGEQRRDDEDTTSSSEDDEEDADAEEPRTAATNRRQAQDMDDGDSEVEEQVLPRKRREGASAFEAIVPAGMDQLEAARIFFDSKKIQEVATCEEVPAVIFDGYREALIMRYVRAFDRLCTQIGKDWLPTSRLLSAIELHLLREDVIHIILSGYGGRAAPEAGQQLGREETRLKPDKGLDLAQAAEAVPAVVAERLHSAAPRLQAMWDEHREDLERALPALHEDKIRADLARALVSNGKVDAEGETLVQRKSLPPIAHVMRRALIELVKGALEAVPAADESGEQYLLASTAMALAGDAVKGKMVWATWLKASKEMMGKSVAKGGSFEEMLDAFRLMEAAWTLVVELLFDSRRDPGIGRIQSYLGPAARAQVARLSEDDAADHAAQLTKWLQRVLGSWEAAIRTFRSSSQLPGLEGTGVMFPSVSKCVEDNGSRYQFQASVVALLARMPKAPSREGTRGWQAPAQQRRGAKRTAQKQAGEKSQRRQGRDGEKEGEERETKRRKEDGARPQVESKKEGDATSLKFSPAKWREMSQKWPEVCRFFLKGSCTRENCKFKHEKPADFEAWCQSCDA